MLIKGFIRFIGREIILIVSPHPPQAVPLPHQGKAYLTAYLIYRGEDFLNRSQREAKRLPYGIGFYFN